MGFGKSVIFQLIPFVCLFLNAQGPDILFPSSPVVIVLSPLVTLTADQVAEAERLGINAAKLTTGLRNNVKSGKFMLVYGVPESWLEKQWTNLLMDLSRNTVCVLQLMKPLSVLVSDQTCLCCKYLDTGTISTSLPIPFESSPTFFILVN